MEELPFEVEFEQEGTDEGELPIGKIIAITLILLVAIAAYFALNYYINAEYATLYIKVKDSHGMPIVNSRVDIIGSNGKMYTRMGSSEYTLKLETGSYKIIVNSPGYKEKRIEIVLKSSREIAAILEKISLMKIVGIKIPEAIICPEKKYGTVSVSNKSGKDEFADISLEGFAGLKVSITPGKLFVPADQNATATIELTCDRVASKRESRVSVALKGSEYKKNFTVTLLPVPEIDFEREFWVSVDENREKILSILFQNMETFSVTGLTLRVSSVKDLNGNDLNGIISFSEKGIVLEKRISLMPDGIEKVNVYIKGIPYKAKATLLLYADFYKKPEEITININSKAGG